jgi:hypothetical protein
MMLLVLLVLFALATYFAKDTRAGSGLAMARRRVSGPLLLHP